MFRQNVTRSDPHQLGLVRIELKTINGHPLTDICDAAFETISCRCSVVKTAVQHCQPYGSRRQKWAALPKHLETSATVSSCRLCSLQSLAASRGCSSLRITDASLSLYRPKLAGHHQTASDEIAFLLLSLGVVRRDSRRRTRLLDSATYLHRRTVPVEICQHIAVELDQVVNRQVDQFIYIDAQFGYH